MNMEALIAGCLFTAPSAKVLTFVHTFSTSCLSMEKKWMKELGERWIDWQMRQKFKTDEAFRIEK